MSRTSCFIDNLKHLFTACLQLEKEGKILVILCENRIFLSIFAEYRGTC